MFTNMSERVRRLAMVIVALIVVGVLLWFINTYIPMARSIKDILNIVVVVATCVFVLQAVGLRSGVMRIWTDLTARILPPNRRV